MTLARRRRVEFEEFAAAHGAELIKLATMVGGDRQRAEDAAQEALIRIYQRWSRLRDPLAYARRAVVNATRDDWRRVQRATRAQDDAAGLSPGPAAGDSATQLAEHDELMTALRRLPHRQRAVIVLRYLSDLSEAETAAVLETSIGTVKSQTHDALGRLRQTLDAELLITTTELETCR